MTDDWPSLDVLRLRYIARVLERAGGNKTKAADMLGIDRRTLNRILARERAKKAAAERFAKAAGMAPMAAPRT
jgi:ActR/RegA family two-component response regulator